MAANRPSQHPSLEQLRRPRVIVASTLGFVVTLLLAIWQEYWVQPEWAAHILNQQYQIAGLGMATLLLLAACIAKYSRETIVQHLLVVAATLTGVAIAMQFITMGHWSVFIAVIIVVSPVYIVGVPSIKRSSLTWTNSAIFLFVAGALAVGLISILAHTNLLLALAVLLPESWAEYLLLGTIGFLVLGFYLVIVGSYLAVMVVHGRAMSESANFPNRPRGRRR